MDDRLLARWAAEDLARLATEWDRAGVLLEPGNERAWNQRHPTAAQQAQANADRRADRDALVAAAKAGVKTLPSAPTPVDLRVVEAMRDALWAVAELAGEIRNTLNLAPIPAADVLPEPAPVTDRIPRDVEPGWCSLCGHIALRSLTGGWWHAGRPHCWQPSQGRPPRFVPREGAGGRALDRIDVAVPTEADLRFRAARHWLVHSGIPAASGDLLEHAATEIRRALRLLTAVTSDQRYTRRIGVACPECGCMSLRAHLDSPNSRDWLVQCHVEECRARWEWDQWGALGGLIGLDLIATVAGESAA